MNIYTKNLQPTKTSNLSFGLDHCKRKYNLLKGLLEF